MILIFTWIDTFHLFGIIGVGNNAYSGFSDAKRQVKSKENNNYLKKDILTSY